MLASIIDEISSKHEKQPQSDQTDLNKIFQDSDYIQKNIEAFQHLKNRDYFNAKNCYKECINISKTLDDDYKFADSLCNYGVTQFFCGGIKDSVESLESANRIILKLNNFADKQKMLLHLKILSNLSLSFLALGKVNESLLHVINIIDTIKKEKENSLQSKFFYLKHVLNIFFRVESLVNYVDMYHKYSFDLNSKTTVTNDNKDSEEVHAMIINRILFYFHKFLRENDIDSWIQCLSEESENFKFIKDYNGFVFALFNQYSAMFVKNPENNLTSSKNKIQSLCKVLIGDKEKSEVEEKSAEKILSEMKDKIKISLEIYKQLHDYEASLIYFLNSQSVNDTSTISYISSDVSRIEIKSGPTSKIFVKIFLRHALRCLTNLEENVNQSSNLEKIKQMKMQINLTLQLIEKDQIDLNSLQLFKIDPEITNSLNILFENLLFIRYKYKLKKYFKDLMYETLGYRTKEDLRFIKDRKFENFESRHYQAICTGSILTKINFSTSGKKEHFYKLDPLENSIRVYQKKSDKNFENLPFKEIKKICYGISSENLKKRFKSMQSSQLNAPWLFFSIMTKKRSIDLYLEDGQLINWFYGVKKHLKETDSKYKLISVNNFLLTKLKLRIIQKLKDDFTGPNKDKIDEKYKEIIAGILQGKKN
jgi:hypothetical protein